MTDVTIRELRNKGGQVIDRVIGGEVLTVTRDGVAVARLVPITDRPLTAEALMRRWQHLPPMDYESLRRDIDEIIDPSVW
jgi:prevent-host-death family protein